MKTKLIPKTKGIMVASAYLGIGTMAVWAACVSYNYSGLSCSNDSQCDPYKIPSPTVCIPGQDETGQQPGPTTTNNVVIDTYSAGTCSGGFRICEGGTLTGQNPNGIVIDQRCVDCEG